jgi:chromosome partitioning protein
MPVIVVAHPEAGVGKTMLATNAAAYLAAGGRLVMLGDAVRSQALPGWLALRPPGLPRVASWQPVRDEVVRPPPGTTHVVLDTPAGMRGGAWDAVLSLADKVLIPMLPGAIEQPVLAWLRDLRLQRRLDVAIVGVRGCEDSIAADRLRADLAQLGLPLLVVLRDTQNYVHLVSHGLSLWDVASSRFDRDREQWQPITAWLES